ncbi:hypothetical protein M885DRAFT_545359 [Pelagophyceae sp. CCMP2097]|nr:hypothetical protein M885DRAFT_545359 [Pelagophyceae sp. CCMP2097]|mmetsp:Transcript_20397/g.69138  ORF Transcript_20397/g.69138 Transcript_20397/m.69138 type:complete len:390 (+) Transcript_20397:202-1371(+)
MSRRYGDAPRVAESKFADDDATYLVRKLRTKLKGEAKSDSVRDLFEQLDRNGDRSITCIEFRSGLKKLGMDLDDWEVRELIRHIDLDGDGEITYREFESFVNSSESKDSDVQDVLDRLRDICKNGKTGYSAMQKCFEAFDTDYSGSIEADELHGGLRKFGITLTVAEADDVVRRFPGRGGRKRIHYKDFVAAIRGTAPASHSMKNGEGEQTASYAVRKLQEEVARCAKTRRGGLDLQGVFKDMDSDHSGTLDRGELRNVLENIGVKLSRSEVVDVMDFFGKGENGEIPYETFCKFALKQDPATQRIAARVRDEFARLAARRGARPDYARAFRELDHDGSGSIDANEFRGAMKNLGLRLSSAESRELMNMFDSDGDGRVSYNEFANFVDA